MKRRPFLLMFLALFGCRPKPEPATFDNQFEFWRHAVELTRGQPKLILLTPYQIEALADRLGNLDHFRA